MSPLAPRYLDLARSGELDRRAAALEALLAPCRLCPHECGDDRRRGATGRCRTGMRAHLASACLHRGEEPVISGARGSGTIFFGGCNLHCVFCQNHTLSQPPAGAALPGPEGSADELGAAMLALQAEGAHNINWVSPSHVVPQAVAGLAAAARAGLRIPIVYNSNGYDGLAALRLLDGVVDVYLPDLKYGADEPAARYSRAHAYTRHAIAALVEMKRQVGDLVQGDDEVAVRGLLVRHLVLPNELSHTRAVLETIARRLGPGTWLSIMSQYYPAHHAARVPLLSRPLRQGEYAPVLAWLEELGLEEGFAQELESAATYRPDFARPGHPFER
ncbi:MAG TPA: radical SAM protein [Polyangia bacterium]